MNWKVVDMIAERRKEKGLSMLALSKICGVHVSNLARFESRERFPTAVALIKLARPLGFSEVQLLKMAGFLSNDRE